MKMNFVAILNNFKFLWSSHSQSELITLYYRSGQAGGNDATDCICNHPHLA